MDRNTIIGLFLIFAIVFTWMTFNSRNQEDERRKKEIALDSARMAAPDTSKTTTLGVDTASQNFKALPDSLKRVKLAEAAKAEFGPYDTLTHGTEDTVHVTTDYLDLRLTTKGGMIAPLYLRDYKTWDGKPLPIVTADTFNKFYLVLFNNKTRTGVVQTKDFYFTTDAKEKVVKLKGSELRKISMRSYLTPTSYIEYVYSFRGDAYDIGLDVNLIGMREYLTDGRYYVHMDGIVPKTEKSMMLMNQRAAVYYKSGGSATYFYSGQTAIQEEELTEKVEWVSFRSQFFCHTLAVKGEPLGYAKVTQVTPQEAVLGYGGRDPGKVAAYMTCEMEVPLARTADQKKQFMFFAGPLQFRMLKDYGMDLEDQLNVGWGPLRWINRGLVMPVFKFLEGAIGNYGVIIFILAVLIKLITLPFTHKTYISSAKMRIINQTPEVKDLEAKFKGDAMKLNQAKMGIYRQMGVNPMGGCIPMLLQYPVLIAMFQFFPNSIELRQQGFLWADDLSTYDSIAEFNFWIPLYGDHVSLFTLLMTISIYLFTFVQQRQQGQMQTNAMLKWMPYIMPLMFLGFLNSYSAGLSYYYFLSNVLSIAQTSITKRLVDDETLLQQMKDLQKEKSKGGGKSAIEKWAERQRKKQDEIMKAKKKK